jgi:hypothetical protein
MSAANLLDGACVVPVSRLAVDGLRGTATLVAGTVAVVVPFLQPSALVFATAVGALGVANSASIGAVISNAGLVNATITLSSFNAADTRAVNWLAISP